jgi:hypothetical protein
MKLGLKPAPLDSSAEEIIIHLFLLRPGANHFAAPELQRYGSLRRARIAISQAAVVVLAAGLAWGGYNMSGAFQASQVDDQVVRQIADLTRQYEEVNRTCRPGVGGATMRDAVAFYNTRIKGFPRCPSLGQLSAVPQARPDVPATGFMAGHRRRESHAAPVYGTARGPARSRRRARVPRHLPGQRPRPSPRRTRPLPAGATRWR